MCKELGVCPQGYYKWRSSSGSQRALRRAAAFHAVKDVFEKHKAMYGSPRVCRELRRQGFHLNHKTVESAMQQQGLTAKSAKKFKATTNSNHSLPVAENILKRNFQPSKANEAWVSDITYVWTDEGWLYLATFLDLWSRKVVGWSMSDRMFSSLVVNAFEMACLQRNVPLCGLIVHSDRGVQYASSAFREAAEAKGVVQSMSRKGNCWDNAPAESFFGSLKKELIHHRKFRSRAEAQAAIFDYIEIFYNKNRLHSSLGYKTPSEFEKAHLTA